MILFKEGIGKLKKLDEQEKNEIIKILDKLNLGYDIEKYLIDFGKGNYYNNNLYCYYNIKIYRR